jgi:pimeloyl-ACP methyl ester carboxylesterase
MNAPFPAAEIATAISNREIAEIERANASGRQPVIFIHGLWLLSNSWDRWSTLFEEAGFAALAPGWPGDPKTVADANADSRSMAGKTIRQVADHLATVALQLNRRPAVIGHSFGGLLAQMIAGRVSSIATVAIDPAGFRGVLPLPFSALKSAFPVLGNPANRGRAVALTYEQFRYAFANAVDETEARGLYDAYAVPAPGAPLFQAAFANFNPWTEVQVDIEDPGRGPLLITSGERDHTVPPAVAKAAFWKQSRNPAVTEFSELKGRGHALTIDHGWREIATLSLSFVQRFSA